MKNILAADIGGTNSRFAHFETDLQTPLRLRDRKWFPTTEAKSFPDLLDQLRASNFSLPLDQADIAVIAVAGPVEKDVFCSPPYISWHFDLLENETAKILPHAFLINDFVAQAYGCRSPIGKTARSIIAGSRIKGSAIGVIGAGTALGKAILLPRPDGEYLALPSEGGHGYFPFLTPHELDFQKFYQEKSGLNHISGNLVVSGRGLRYLHWFLTGDDLEPKQVTALFSENSGSMTLAWASKFYGRICRDFTLDILARGGLYIAGGVAAKAPKLLTHKNFRNAFSDSETMGHILKQIPVFLMDNQDSGLWGAGFQGSLILQKELAL